MQRPEKDGWEGGDGRGTARIALLGALAVLCSLASFFLWKDQAGEGEISRAAAYFEELVSENEAIAVFFGWDGK